MFDHTGFESVERGIYASQICVRDFHQKMGIDYRTRLDDTQPRLGAAGSYVATIKDVSCRALDMFHASKDVRWLRVHLISEELAELILGMSENDPVQSLDALGDLLYVVLGTAVSLDLPLSKAFVEIHLSNMSKEPQENDPDRARVRDKGPRYQKPDVAGCITEDARQRGDVREVRSRDNRVDDE